MKNLFKNRLFDIEDGCVSIKSDPGWGFEINDEWLSKSNYQISNFE